MTTDTVTDAQDELMTLSEVAAYLKVSKNTLRNWHEQGQYEWVKLPGGQIRVWRSVVDGLLREVAVEVKRG